MQWAKNVFTILKIWSEWQGRIRTFTFNNSWHDFYSINLKVIFNQEEILLLQFRINGDDFSARRSGGTLKRLTHCFAHIEKFSLNFSSSSFVIRVNFLHP